MPGVARWVARAVLALVCVGTAAPLARAEVRIAGDEAAVQIFARDASIAEVFVALKANFRFRYNLAIEPERRLNGTISGPLHRVVAQLLDGYDFVLRRAPDGIEVVRVAPRGGANWTPPVRPGVTLWQTPAAQAMRPGPPTPE